MSYIGNSPENVLRNRRAIYEFVATAGQTAFSGVDSNGATLDLLQDNEQSVFLNGVRIIATDDYTVSGETLTLVQAASVGDILIVETQGEVANATTYTRSESDQRYVNYNGDVISGDIQISGGLTASSLAIDTDVLYVDDTNDRVGINLPGLNPQEALHVAGNIRVNNNQEFRTTDTGGNTRTIMRVNGSDQLEYGWSGAGPVKFMGGGSYTERMRIHTNSNIGIGTDNPPSLLSVRKTVSTFEDVVSIIGQNSPTDIMGALSYDQTIDTMIIRNDQTYATGGIAFRAGGSNNHLFIQTGGQVGIGTSSPNSTLQITPPNDHQDSFRIYRGGSNGYQLNYLNMSLYGGDVISNVVSSDTSGKRFIWQIDGTESAKIEQDGNVYFNGGENITTTTGNTNLQVLTTNSQGADLGGSIGMGGVYHATNQITFAEIHGKKENGTTANLKGYMSFVTRDAGGSTEKMRITSDGKVGIGTDDPAVALHIGDGTSDEFIIVDKGSSSTSGILFRNSGSNKVKLQVNTDEELEIYTNNSIKAKVSESGTVYSYNDQPTVRPSFLLDFVNSKKLDPRVSFTRTSTGTYYDGESEVLADQNILRNSSNMGSAPWSTSAYTMTANAATRPGRYGTVWRASPNSSGANTSVAINSGVGKTTSAYTFSVYAKIDSTDYPAISLYWNSSGSANVRFDLTNGTVAHVNNGNGTMTGSIYSAGNGWYRCVTTYVGATSSEATMYVLDSINGSDWSLSNGPDGVKGMLLWGPQIEQRSYVTAYNNSSGYGVHNYQKTLVSAPAGEPRFDHDPITGESKGLLIEKYATNLLSHSEAFSNWTQTGNARVRNNLGIAPDGTATADEIHLIGAGGNAQNRISFDTQVQSSGAGVYTFSCYLKSSGLQYAGMNIFDGTAYVGRAVFDLYNGTLVYDNAGNNLIEDVGNGWYRCMVTVTTTGVLPTANVASGIWPRYTVGDSANAEVGDATQESKGILAWGAQYEQAPYASSYIKTAGSSASRSVDVAQVDNHFADIYTYSDSSIYGEWAKKYNAGYNNNSASIIKFGQGGGGYVHMIQSAEHYLNGYQGARVYWNQSAVAGAGSKSFPSDFTVIQKEGMAWKDGEFAWVANNNGGTTEMTPGVIPKSELTTLHIGRGWGSTAQIDGYARKIAYYPAQLSTAQLELLTED